ncbi:MAG: hypothetical protein R2794_11670 [Chitinophagales bacterium]
MSDPHMPSNAITSARNKENLFRLFDRIEKHHVALMHMLQHKPDSIHIPVAAGKWTPAQIVEHVHFSFMGSLRYLHKKLQYPDTITQNRPAAWIRIRVLLWILQSDIKTKAPKVIAQAPADRDMETLEQQWRDIRAQIIVTTDNFPKAC